MSNVNNENGKEKKNQFSIYFTLLNNSNKKYFVKNQLTFNEIELNLDEKNFSSLKEQIKKNNDLDEKIEKEIEKISMKSKKSIDELLTNQNNINNEIKTRLKKQITDQCCGYLIILVNEIYHYMSIDIFEQILNKIDKNENFFSCFNVNIDNNEILILDKKMEFTNFNNEKFLVKEKLEDNLKLQNKNNNKKKNNALWGTHVLKLNEIQYSKSIVLENKEISLKLTSSKKEETLHIPKEKIIFSLEKDPKVVSSYELFYFGMKYSYWYITGEREFTLSDSNKVVGVYYVEF